MIAPILSSFTLWLNSRQYSPSTIRNYLVDTNKYLDFIANSLNILPELVESNLPIVFATDSIRAYIAQISDNTNTQRYLASLNIFCQFALNQNIIKSNPLAKIRKEQKRDTASNPIANLHRLKSDFASHLSQHQHSQTTIKNYINDIDQYINWLATNHLEPQ